MNPPPTPERLADLRKWSSGLLLGTVEHAAMSDLLAHIDTLTDANQRLRPPPSRPLPTLSSAATGGKPRSRPTRGGRDVAGS